MMAGKFVQLFSTCASVVRIWVSLVVNISEIIQRTREVIHENDY